MFAEQQIVVALLRVDALAAGLDDDLAVEDPAATVADDAAEALGADGRARGVADQCVLIDVLVAPCEQQTEEIGARAASAKRDRNVVADESPAEIEITGRELGVVEELGGQKRRVSHASG